MEGDADPTSVSGNAHPDSQDRATNPHGNSVKGHGCLVSGTAGLLAMCLFSEVTSSTPLIRSCMYCGLRKHYPYVNEKFLERVCMKVGNTSKTSKA